MRYTFLSIIVGTLLLGHAHNVAAQFTNTDFSSGSDQTSPHTITDWANGNAQWVPQDYVNTEDPFIDLTGTWFGNGNYIEQKIYTSNGKRYKITFDLATFYGWDLWDAGVSVTLDGIALGSRIWHDQFTHTRDTFMYWKRMSTIEFNGTGGYTTVRFTGDSRLVQSYGDGRGVGVIGFDNVSLEEVSTNAVKITGISAQVNVFPNPANADISIAWPKDVQTIAYEICDLSGKTVLSGNTTDLHISLSSVDVGLYLLRLRDEEGQESITKLLVQR